jgi:hypothetical protein
MAKNMPTPETTERAFESRSEFLRFVGYFLEKLSESNSLEAAQLAASTPARTR